MIEKIARRAGGFAATTALRWAGAGRDALPDAVAAPRREKHSSRLVAGAAAGALALVTNKTVRTGVEQGLLALSRAVRPSAGNGNGNGGLTSKTRAELYELAKKADLPGRSTMSKDELAKALDG